MSDEESFVILGTSPNDSLLTQPDRSVSFGPIQDTPGNCLSFFNNQQNTNGNTGANKNSMPPDSQEQYVTSNSSEQMPGNNKTNASLMNGSSIWSTSQNTNEATETKKNLAQTEAKKESLMSNSALQISAKTKVDESLMKDVSIWNTSQVTNGNTENNENAVQPESDKSLKTSSSLQTNGNSKADDSLLNGVSILNTSKVSNAVPSNNPKSIDKSPQSSSLEREGLNDNTSPVINSINISVNQHNDKRSLASNFILGNLKPEDVMKASLLTQFPSISMQSSAEEFARLDSIVKENIKMKDVCRKADSITRNYYSFVQKSFDELKTQMTALKAENMELKEELENQRKQINNEENQKKFEDLQTQITKLKDENRVLKTDIDQHNFELASSIYQKDFEEFKQKLSEKDALIMNMRHYIEKLEPQQVPSYDYVPENYVEKAELAKQMNLYQENLTQMKQKINSLEEENRDLRIQQTVYLDEINCLKVNCAAAEELLCKARDDIGLLQAKDFDKEKTIQFMRSEIAALREQSEMFAADFDLERRSREELAGEKDQLLQDLRALQIRNQQLLEEAEERNRTISISSADGAVGGIAPIIAKTPAYDNPNRPELPPNDEAESLYRCPVCTKGFKCVKVLQSHANDCLDSVK